MTTVICKKPFEEGGRIYQPGETLVLRRATAKTLAQEDIVEIVEARTPGMRDKMIYSQHVRHGHST